MLVLFSQTLGITAPVFAMLFLGVLLRRLGWIDVALPHRLRCVQLDGPGAVPSFW